MQRYTNGTQAILPFDVNKMLVEPVQEQSVAMQVFTVIPTDRAEVQLPCVTEGATAEFVGELEDYGTDSITIDEVTIKPRKIGKTIPASEELVDDSDPSATELIGEQLTNSIATAIDTYTFGAQAASDKAFAGIANSTAYNFTTIDGSAHLDWNLDYFIDASTALAGAGKPVDYYVANSLDIAELNKIKESDGSRRNVLQSDPTLPGVTVVNGSPLVPCNAIPVGTIWAVNSKSAAIVLRKDSDVVVDRSVGFKRDEVWFKGTMRVAFGVLDNHGIVKIIRDTA